MEEANKITTQKSGDGKKNLIIGILIGAVVILGVMVFARGEQTTTVQPPISTPSPSPQSEIPPSKVITAQEAWNKVGEVATVEYYVGNPYRSSKGNVFLNEKRDFKNGFVAVIFANSVAKFNNPVSTYGYKTIQVTGLIKMYQGHPEIVVDAPSQIKVAR